MPQQLLPVSVPRAARVEAEREQLLRMRAGLIRAIREIDALLGIHGTFAKDVTGPH